MNFWKRALRGLALAILGIYAAMFFMQRELMYPLHQANREPWRTPEQAGLAGFVQVPLTTADGVRVVLWYHPAAAGRPTFLFFLGNSATVSRSAKRWESWAELGYGVAALSYRGYGISEGKPTEAGLYEDARAARRFLNGRGVADGDIVLYGRSLGSGVAMQLAGEMRPRAVVLVSPYTSMPEMAAALYPWLPGGGSLVRDRYDSLSKAARIRAPILIIHGEQDGLVPAAMARRLFEALSPPKRYGAIEDGTHNNLPWPRILREVEAFLAALPERAAE